MPSSTIEKFGGGTKTPSLWLSPSVITHIDASRLVSSLLFSSLLVSSSPKTQTEDQRTRILERRERGRPGLGSEEEEEKRRRLRRGTSLLGFRFSVGSESVIGK